jgi:hypothetical protein
LIKTTTRRKQKQKIRRRSVNYMKLRNTVLIGAAVAMAAMLQTAQAVLTDSLADLTSATGTYNSLSIGDKTFSDFGYTASALTGFDAADVKVTASVDASGVYYLTWSGNVAALASLTPTTGDLLLNYKVSASAGVIATIDQGYTGSGIIKVDETVSPSSGGVPIVGSSHLDAFDMSDPPAEANDLLHLITPGSVLYVTKDIGLAALPGNDFATISQVEQSFEQVPEPTTVLAGALLLLPLGASTLRILRRNRMS